MSEKNWTTPLQITGILDISAHAEISPTTFLELGENQTSFASVHYALYLRSMQCELYCIA